MSRYDFIRFGGFVNWADEDTDTFRKMKVCLPVKEPVEDDTKIGLISTDEDNPEEIAVSYSVRLWKLFRINSLTVCGTCISVSTRENAVDAARINRIGVKVRIASTRMDQMSRMRILLYTKRLMINA